MWNWKEVETITKRGRPRKEEARRGQYRLRTNEEEEKMLDYIHENTGETKADILRRGLKTLYNLEKTRHYLDIQ